MNEEQRPVRILRALARSPDGCLSTPGIVDQLAEGIEPRQRALAWYGGILRPYAGKGYVEKAGRTPVGWQRPGAFIWRITEEGRKLLACIDDAPRREAEHERLNDEIAEAARLRDEALTEAAQLYSRDTPRGDRWAVARHLRSLGCTLEDIGSIFDVSREMIRQDLLLSAPPSGRPGPKPRRRSLGGPRFTESAVTPDGVLMLRIGKRKLYLTKDEAAQLAGVIQAWKET